MTKMHKQTIRRFMQDHYTDERLAMLLAHAQSGRLVHQSCCCFIGIPTAEHALKSEVGRRADFKHYEEAAIMLDDSGYAELSFIRLGEDDEERRRKLIPMIRAEMRRRENRGAARNRGAAQLAHLTSRPH